METQKVNPMQLQLSASIDELTEQRSIMGHRAANLAGQLALAQVTIAELEARVQELTPKDDPAASNKTECPTP